MDSINKKSKTTTAPIAILGAFLLLQGCGLSSSVVQSKAQSSNNKASEKVKSPDPILVDTLKYLPSQSYDKQGNKIPYQTAENPYLTTKGQIPEAEVNLYVAALSANRRGHLELARKKLEKLTEMSSTLSGPWVKLGQVAKKEGKTKEAEHYFRKAIAVNSKNVNAYIDLALIQREQGKFIAAQNTYAKALKLWPDFPEAHLNLGVLYDLYLNQAENAQAHYEAYQFLTQSKNKTVASWLNEVQDRTGIHESFIDTPPLPSEDALPAANEKKTGIKTATL
jgi:tetratricopeptide (TPR) repeat protein